MAEAKLEAETVAARLTSSEPGLVRLTSADSAAYLRAKELLDPLGIPIEVAAAEVANAHKRLGGVRLSRAIEDFVKRNPADILPRHVDDVIAETLEAKEADGASPGYVRHVRYDVRKFAVLKHDTS